eukprot:8419993-Pyramimonas_sp.AAC.1
MHAWVSHLRRAQGYRCSILLRIIPHNLWVIPAGPSHSEVSTRTVRQNISHITFKMTNKCYRLPDAAPFASVVLGRTG